MDLDFRFFGVLRVWSSAAHPCAVSCLIATSSCICSRLVARSRSSSHKWQVSLWLLAGWTILKGKEDGLWGLSSSAPASTGIITAALSGAQDGCFPLVGMCGFSVDHFASVLPLSFVIVWIVRQASEEVRQQAAAARGVTLPSGRRLHHGWTWVTPPIPWSQLLLQVRVCGLETWTRLGKKRRGKGERKRER